MLVLHSERSALSDTVHPVNPLFLSDNLFALWPVNWTHKKWGPSAVCGLHTLKVGGQLIPWTPWLHGQRSVSLQVTWLQCANMADWIDVPLRVETLDFSHGFHAAFEKLAWPVDTLVDCVLVVAVGRLEWWNIARRWLNQSCISAASEEMAAFLSQIPVDCYLSPKSSYSEPETKSLLKNCYRLHAASFTVNYRKQMKETWLTSNVRWQQQLHLWATRCAKHHQSLEMASVRLAVASRYLSQHKHQLHHAAPTLW